MVEKKPLSAEDLEAQVALELPDRHLLGYLVKVNWKSGDITLVEFDTLIQAQRFCVQVALSANKCEITGGGGQH